MRALLLGAPLLIVGVVHAHEAPSGWEYPSGCCNGEDCRPISCSTIKDNPDGSVNWTGLHFYQSQVKMSGDGQCHVCVGYDQIMGTQVQIRNARCIFLSPNM